MDNAGRLRELAIKAAQDPEILDKLDEDDINMLRRAANPAGGINGCNTCYANVSITNFEDKGRVNFLMMALIGFVYRLAKEYEPEPVDINKKWNPQIEKSTGDTRKRLIAGRDAEIKAFHMERRAIVTQFLDRNFEHNPDIHVREAKSAGFTDKERQAKMEQIRAAMDAEKIKAAEASLRRENAFDTMKKIVHQSYNAMASARVAITNSIKALQDPRNDLDDKIGILMKKGALLTALTNNLAKVHVPLSAAATIEAFNVRPPADVFHHFERYISNHNEALYDLCRAFFINPPDMEFAITLYSVHNDEKEAAEYCRQHNNDFRAQVDTISSGGMTILGPFRENRDRVNYYNQNVEVLRAIAEQNELDARLGKDILEKAVQRKKAANIRSDGPDRAGLKNYASSVSMGTVVNGEMVGTHVSHDGAKKVIPHDKMKDLEKKIAADAAVGDSGGVGGSAAESQTTTADLDALLAQCPPLPQKPSAPTSAADAAASTASAANATSANTTSDPVGPKIDERSAHYNIVNLEAHYKERAPIDKLDADAMSGNYKVNDTDDSELPDNAVQMQMFIPQENADGELVLTQKYMYTQAERPLHLEKNSPYAEEYQPVNPTNAPMPMKETTVVNARGDKSVVHIIDTDKLAN